MTPREKMIEKMAGAIGDHRLWSGAFDSMNREPQPWGGSSVERDNLIAEATAALDAILPELMEVTGEMMDQGVYEMRRNFPSESMQGEAKRSLHRHARGEAGGEGMSESQRDRIIAGMRGAIDVQKALCAELTRLRAENERLRKSMLAITVFAETHHQDQPAHVLLHSLTIDIPSMTRATLQATDQKEG